MLGQSRFRKQNNKGFTLVEVLITLTIMATLTIMTAQAVRNSLRGRNKIEKKLEGQSRLRLVSRIITRDINQAFHYRDIEQEILLAVDEERRKKKTSKKGKNEATKGNEDDKPTNGNQPTNPFGIGNPPPEDNRPPLVVKRDKLTHFVGQPNQIHFTSLSNVRTTVDSKESNIHEVGYFLRDCKPLLAKANTSTVSCLWRRSDPYIDDDVTMGGSETVLMENVETLSFRYLGPEKGDWVESWRSDSQGDAVTQTRFPYAVEVTMEIPRSNRPDSKNIKLTFVAAIHFPNNSEKGKK